MSRQRTTEFEYAASAGEAFLGFEVSWDLGEYAMDCQIPREKFVKAFIDVGAPVSIFSDCTPEHTLPKAAAIGWRSETGIDARTISVKPLSKTDKGCPLAYGVFYRVSVEGERDRWEMGARVRLVNNRAKVEAPPEGAFQDDAKKWAEAIAHYTNSREDVAYNADISEALVSFGRHLGWLSRRAGGGVYFLSGDRGRNFVKVLDALETLTRDRKPPFEGSTVAQYADPRTLRTWQRRAETTIDAEITRLTERLADMEANNGTQLGSFDTKIAECSALMTMAEQYAQVLEKKLDPLKRRIAALGAKFGSARDKLADLKSSGDAPFRAIAALTARATKKAAPPTEDDAVVLPKTARPVRARSTVKDLLARIS